MFQQRFCSVVISFLSLCHPILFCLSTLLYSAFLLPPFCPLYWSIFSICLGRLAPAFLCSVSHWQELSWVIWQTVFTHPLHVGFPWTPTAPACKLHERGRTTRGCLGSPCATSATLGAQSSYSREKGSSTLLDSSFNYLKGKNKPKPPPKQNRTTPS